MQILAHHVREQNDALDDSLDNAFFKSTPSNRK
jgi:hypothetical protein